MQLTNIKNYLTRAHSNKVLTLDDEYIYSRKIGKLGIFDKQINHFLPQFESVVKDLKNTNSNTKYFKVLHPVNTDEEFGKVAGTAKIIRENFKKIIVIAMGGSTLNPQAIVNLLMDKADREVEFITTTDPVKLSRIAKSLSKIDTAFIVISNSGETIEVIAMLNYFACLYDASEIGKHFFFVIGKSENSIHSFAQNHKAATIEFDTNVSGRFSTFTTCTTLILEVLGLNSQKLLEGSNALKQEFWQDPFSSVIMKSVCFLHLANLPISVLMTYTQDAQALCEWFAQIIGESLGKENKGITPIRCLGPEDQHSQLQLYIEGTKNKSFTFIKFNDDTANVDLIKLEMLKNNSIHQVHNAFYEATFDALKSLNVPIRKIEIIKKDEFSIGYLMMLMTFEVVLSGMLMKINPFNQNGVELIKIRAREILAGI